MKSIMLIDVESEFTKDIEDKIMADDVEITAFINEYKGVQHLLNNNVSVVLMSTFLDYKGIYFLRVIKDFNPKIKVIVLAKKINHKLELEYLQLGADEYIYYSKIDSLVVERIKRILNNIDTEDAIDQKIVIHSEKLIVNIKQRSTVIDNKYIKLSSIEFNILVYLLQNINTIISREEFLENIWHVDNSNIISDPRYVDVHIKNIRKKTGLQSIKTVRGLGYQFLIENLM